MEAIELFLTDTFGQIWTGVLGGLGGIFATRLLLGLVWEARNLTPEELGFRRIPAREPNKTGAYYQRQVSRGLAPQRIDHEDGPLVDRIVRGRLLWRRVHELRARELKSERWKNSKHLRTRLLGRKVTRIAYDGEKFYLMRPKGRLPPLRR